MSTPTPSPTTTPDPNTTTTPFWNTNLPPPLHTPTCPPYLLYALQNPKDRAILATPDALCPRHTWPQVQRLIATNRLDSFRRVPSELRRYRQLTAEIVAEHGSVRAFIVKERLGWEGTEGGSGGGMFECEADFKILPNDSPYALAPCITHLVVWTKFPLPCNPGTAGTEDLTPAARAHISAFVDKTFVRDCGEGNVVWFMNWRSLKSVHAVEHFHVMLFEAPEGFVGGVTGG
ncbi:hypothetical protein LTR08_001930 [Meristemomyces frigidus]|nr:hypothetical protein LTR08_001930 [Meristemomyces frigidus]